jgi:uncharacterized protein YtpQ (UPF0354 family)
MIICHYEEHLEEKVTYMSDLYEGVKAICEKKIEENKIKCSQCEIKELSMDNVKCKECPISRDTLQAQRELIEIMFPSFFW